MLLLSVEGAPFEWVGLKFGSGDRRAGEDTRPYGDPKVRLIFCRADAPIGPFPGGPDVPPLRFERTALITGTVPLIRLASLGTFP